MNCIAEAAKKFKVKWYNCLMIIMITDPFFLLSIVLINALLNDKTTISISTTGSFICNEDYKQNKFLSMSPVIRVITVVG